MSPIVLTLLALLLVALNGVFVAAEFSFVKARKTKLELMAAAGNGAAKSALFGVTHLDAYLSVCQLGITLASLALGWVGEPAVAHLIQPILVKLSISSPTLTSSISIVVGFTIITFLHVVFGELAPKSISIQKAERTVLLLARPMYFFYFLCLPVVRIMTGISNLFLRVVGIHPVSESEQSHSEEELRLLIIESRRDGQIDKDEGRMLDNIFTFYQKTAKDVMVHRSDVVAFDVRNTREHLRKMAEENGHTRFPVYEDSRDNIIGFVHIKDLLTGDENSGLKTIVREPVYAPESMPLENLLQQMQISRLQFSVVLDEYGVWQGIASMEDIVEAIVGDIQDEFDNEEPAFQPQPDGSYLVSADMSLDDLAEHVLMDCKDPDMDQYKILASHFIEELERIPRPGDAIELCNKRFTITTMDRNRVLRVRMEDLSSKQE